MYLHPEKKLVFLAQPHTASHSIAEALLLNGFQLGKSNISVVAGAQRRPFHHADLDVGGHVRPENRHEWTVFSVVRNHFDLVLSRAWKFANYAADFKGEEKWFRKALTPTWWVGQDTLFGRFRPQSDILLRFEILQEELEDITGPITLPVIHENPHRQERSYREFYTPETRAMVEDRFWLEMKELGYTW